MESGSEQHPDNLRLQVQGKRFDTGDRLGYVKSIIDFALKNENLRDDVLEYLRDILTTVDDPLTIRST